MSDSNQPNAQGQQRQWVERSRKPDWVLRSVTIVTIIGWVGAMVALALYYLGSPADSKIGGALDAINPNIGAGGTGFTNRALLRGAFVAVAASFLVCVIGFILNVTRHKRKTDKYNKLLITLWVISAVFIAVFLINYGGSLFA